MVDADDRLAGWERGVVEDERQLLPFEPRVDHRHGCEQTHVRDDDRIAATVGAPNSLSNLGSIQYLFYHLNHLL